MLPKKIKISFNSEMKTIFIIEDVYSSNFMYESDFY